LEVGIESHGIAGKSTTIVKDVNVGNARYGLQVMVGGKREKIMCQRNIIYRNDFDHSR
jgi:hypothetical protein